MLINKLKLLKKRLLGQFVLEDHISMGLQVGRNFKAGISTKLDYPHCWHIKIGDDVTFGPEVMVLAHDASMKTHFNYTKIRNVVIGNNVFVGARVIILPGVTLGNNVIIGAGSLVSRDMPSNSLAVGNPIKIVCSTEDYLKNQKEKMSKKNTFNESYTIKGNITKDKQAQIIKTTTELGESFVI